MKTVEWSGTPTGATRLLVANRVQRRSRTTRAADTGITVQRTFVTLTAVQFVGSADLAAWEQSPDPRLLVHLLREEPADTVLDSPEGTEALTIDGTRMDLLPPSAVDALRARTWDWTDALGPWDWTVGTVHDEHGFVFVSGLGIALEDVTQRPFVSVDLDMYFAGRERWLDVLENE